MDIGQQKANQVANSFKKGISQDELLKSFGYSDEEIRAGIVLNDETPDGLVKGKLNTSNLMLKDVMVNGKMQKRWVDPNKGNKEHAQTGSDIEFTHKGKSMKGKVGNVLKTGEYAVRGEDGKTYNKHAHQFASPHIEAKVRGHAEDTDTEKLQEYVDKEGIDPKLKKVAQEELANRKDGKGGAESSIGDTKKMSKEQLDDLDDEADEDMDINKKFKTYERFVRMTAKGLTKSTIAYGGGGVGKTYTATKQLEAMKNPKTGKPFVFYDEEKHEAGSDDYDVIKITGKASTAGLYKSMYQHNGKLILFDDCDEVLSDPNSVNMFKGALDSSGDGTISNLTATAIKDDNGNPIPQRYKFSGRAIFISNLPPNKMPQPLKSRALRIDLSMDADQTVKRIKEIATTKEGKLTNIKLEDVNGDEIKYEHEDMDDAIKFIDKYKDKMGDLNVRTLGSLVKMIHDSKSDEDDDGDWKIAAKHMVLSKGFATKSEDISKAFKTLLK